MTIRAHERNGWVIVYWDCGPDSEQDVIVARFGGRRPLTDAYKDAAYLMAALRKPQP